MPAKPVVFIPGFIASQLIQKSKNNRVIFPPSIGDLVDKDKKNVYAAKYKLDPLSFAKVCSGPWRSLT